MKMPFERVVALHGPSVLRVCRAVVGVDDADDAWSETFIAALRAYPGLPDDANVEAWLVTVAHRKAIDLLRARNRRAITVETLPEPAARDGIASQKGPADDLELMDAVGRLPERQRQCVAYHYLGGLPYRDVAELVGGTAEAARRAAADGIRSLRRSYGDGENLSNSNNTEGAAR
ncbi:RNA polymerase sigma factor [Agreia sp. COWG]|uniref:RNA polymerase sigma factor n=1 Tax=Agreia sp. COWG TaxID=2773266 RepID=UPI0019272AC7|nr:RNA polymerase sigma factor [Agreia sp. COWG]